LVCVCVFFLFPFSVVDIIEAVEGRRKQGQGRKGMDNQVAASREEEKNEERKEELLLCSAGQATWRTSISRATGCGTKNLRREKEKKMTEAKRRS